MRPFHDLTKRVEGLAQKFAASKTGNPDILERLNAAIEASIKDPYSIDLVTNTKELRLHTALVILESPHLHEAIRKIAQERDIKIQSAKQAMRAVLQAVGDVMGESYMASIHALHLSNGLYVHATKEEISEFSKDAMQNIPQNLRPIMDHALIARYTKPEEGGVEVRSKVISYVMMQLMPPGQEKNFKLNSAYMKTHPGDISQCLSISADIVRTYAQKLGISIPLEFLIDTQKQADEFKLSSRLGEQFYAPAQPHAEDVPSYVDLRDDLKELKDRNIITGAQAIVYLQVHNPDLGKAITKEEAANKFFLSIPHVVVLEKHIEACLELLEREENGEIVEFPQNPQPNMVIKRGPSVHSRADLTARSG